MKITEIYIKSFGKLRGIKISPTDGVNIIYGDNEAGKSTVMSFVLAMLYGLGKGEQRHRYEPWGGGRIAGIITFEHDGKGYSLSRMFGATKAADKTELWCTTTGEQLSVPERIEPGEHVLGIGKETFINSVYIGQAGVPIKGDNNEILAKLTNLAASGDETASRTEINQHLDDAASLLRSRKANAILPNLERERLELLESRAVIVKRSEEAEVLRDDITKLTHRTTRLSEELGILTRREELMSDLKQLRGYEEIIARKASLDEAESKYTALHDNMFSEDGGLTHEFMDEVRGLLEQYRTQQTEIKMLGDRISECDDKAKAVDREPLKKMRVFKKHKAVISEKIDEYFALREERDRLEVELEGRTEEKNTGKLSVQNVIIVAGALVILFILLGFIENFFFILAAIIAVIAGAYIYVQKKGVSFEVLPGENIQLTNINEDMRELNRSMRPILDEMDVPNIEALERELRSIKGVKGQITEIEREKERLIAASGEKREQTEDTLRQLKEMLAPFTAVESDAEAVKIISKLDKLQCEYAALEARYHTEQESFESLLNGREFDDILIEAEILREKLGDSASSTVETPEHFEETIDKCRADLTASREELIQKETQLGLMNSDPQELNKLNEELKVLTDRIDHYEFEYSALEEAKSALDDAFESMQKDFGPMINYRAGKIVSALTGQKYGSVIISESLTPSVAEPGGTIHTAQVLSGGTSDQIYLALRLAIAGILSEDNLPLLLDEAFAQYDDKRMADALYYLGKENGSGRLGQVILFTCHERVISAAKEVGLTDGIVKLQG